MPVLITAVVAVGILCCVDLLLTFGVVRRLREHTELLAARGGANDIVVGLVAGQAPAGFSARTANGEYVSGPAGLRLVAFFSPTCPACPERVPAFTEYLASHHISPRDVLAVIEDGASEPPPYLGQLMAVAQVCAGQDSQAVTDAFEVSGYPAFCLLDAEGALMASSFDPAVLPVPAGV
ncbi:MAG TPA: hypothetical protein VGS19_16835 [Streptosporangiaceae bacterium]|nr:hypothetical protein [Streptosporangiaceae bacterium]